MAIYKILEQSAFEPEDVERLAAAYELALRDLGLKSRGNPITEIIAKRIINVAQTGVKDPQRICALVIEQLGLSRSA